MDDAVKTKTNNRRNETGMQKEAKCENESETAITRIGASSRSLILIFALCLLALMFAVAVASPLLLLGAHAEDGSDSEAQPEPQELVIDWEKTDFYIRSMEAQRIGGTETETGMKMGQGSSSPFVMVEWQVTNNMDLSRPFLAHVPTKSLTVPNQSGRVPYNGEFVGSYDVKQGEDGAVDLLISLEPEMLMRQSDIRGGVRVNCQSNMDPRYELPENQACDMRFGEATCWVSYDAPGSYSLSKSMKNLTKKDDGTYVARYAIGISYRGLMRNRILTDSPSSSTPMEYLDGSLTATLDNQPLEVSETKVGKGFSVPLPDSNDGKSSHQMNIEYDMQLTSQPSTIGGSLYNAAKLSFTNESGNPSELSRTCSVSMKPDINSLKKEGTPIFDSGTGSHWLGYGAQYAFGVLYTISFSSSNLKNLPDAQITIDDILGESELRNGRYVSTEPASSDNNRHLGFNNDGTFGSIFGRISGGGYQYSGYTSCYSNNLFYTSNGNYNGSRTTLDPVKAEQYAYNACRIFKYGFDNTFTVSDLETSDGNNYVLHYIMPVTSFMTTFQIDNAVNLSTGDRTYCAKTTTPIKPSRVNLITKIADKGYQQHGGWHNNYGYNYVNSQELEYSYSLQSVLNEDQRTVSYSVPVCLSHLARPYKDDGTRRYQSSGAWASRFSSSGGQTWKIIDAPYQSYSVSQTGQYATSINSNGTQMSTAELMASIRNLRVEVYRDSTQSYSNYAIPTWSPTMTPSWKAAENAYVTYALEHGTPTAPKEGYDEATFQSLYSAYVGARDSEGYGSYYLGEVRFGGNPSNPYPLGDNSSHYVRFSFQDGQIVVTLDSGGFGYATGYNDVLNWNNGDGFGFSQLASGQDCFFVLRYDLAVTDDGKSLVSYNARYNGARLQLDWLEQPEDMSGYFLVANTSLNAPSGTTSTPSKPRFYKSIYANEKDESGYTRKTTYQVTMEVSDRSHIAFEDAIPDDLELLTGADGRPDVKALWCSSHYNVPSEPTFVDASEVDISYADGKLTVGMDIPEEKPNNYVVFLIGTRPKLSCLSGSIRNEACDISSEDESLQTKGNISFSPTLPPLVHKHFVSNTWEEASQNPNPYSENGKWYAYYEIDVDPWGDDIDHGRDILVVRDDMGLSLALVEDSVQFVSTETKEPIAGGSFEAVENGWKFTVPDGQATSIRYKVALSEEDTPILHMGDSDSLRNSAVLVLGDKEYSQSTAGQSDKLMGQYAWIESSNGSVTLFKFHKEGGGDVPLAGAKFSLESAWDNLGNRYEGHVGDDIYAAYQEFVVEDAATGRKIIASLPKDRIYKLTETGLPEGYTYPAGHDAGTWYFYVAGQNEAALLATDIPNDIRKGLIKVDDGGLLPIENVNIVQDEADEASQPGPVTAEDKSDSPEEQPAEVPTKEEPKPAETPKQQPVESGQANDTVQPTGTRTNTTTTKGPLLQTGETMLPILMLAVITCVGAAGYVMASKRRYR